MQKFSGSAFRKKSSCDMGRRDATSGAARRRKAVPDSTPANPHPPSNVYLKSQKT